MFYNKLLIRNDIPLLKQLWQIMIHRLKLLESNENFSKKSRFRGLFDFVSRFRHVGPMHSINVPSILIRGDESKSILRFLKTLVFSRFKAPIIVYNNLTIAYTIVSKLNINVNLCVSDYIILLRSDKLQTSADLLFTYIDIAEILMGYTFPFNAIYTTIDSFIDAFIHTTSSANIFKINHVYGTLMVHRVIDYKELDRPQFTLGISVESDTLSQQINALKFFEEAIYANKSRIQRLNSSSDFFKTNKSICNYSIKKGK
jgi:hypothetical protein